MRKVLQFLVSPPTASQLTEVDDTQKTTQDRQHMIDSKPTNYVIALAIVLLMTAIGCGDPNRAKIVGTWNIDSPKAIDRVRQEPDAAETDSAQDDLEQIRPKMIVHFYRSGALETETDMGRTVSKKSGTWKLVSFDESKKKLVIECNLTNQTTQHDVLIDDANTIRMVPPNMAGLTKKLKFNRD